MKQLPKLLITLSACFFVAFVGSMVTIPAIPTWYAGLQKPFFTPPNWLFGPVWTALFLTMSIAAYTVWRKGIHTPGVKTALAMFTVQLGLNFLWSLFFFGLHQPLLAFIDIMALWVAIFLTIQAFFKISRTAAMILVPYLAWVSFAVILNLAIILLDR